MCGIAGFVAGNDSASSDELHVAVTAMADTLRARGPDDEGTWVDRDAGIALGHRRLAIVDLSSNGRQPMSSACGRYVIAFNGEIYNFREIRLEIDITSSPHDWRGRSDTEVILACVTRWGFVETLNRLTGMFAISLWDRQSRTLHLARDRIGEKPLYYGLVGDTFLFGSELKALRAYPKWHGTVNRNALASYVRYGYVPTPISIYEGILKLPAGTHLCVNVEAWRRGRDQIPKPIPYWSLEKVAAKGLQNPIPYREAEAVDELEKLLKLALSRQMIADVPLGAFLSGGIDSSTVVALMQAQSTRPVKTFTIGFHEVGYDEATHAKAIASYLGTDHTELYVSPGDALAVVPKLATLYDEPFADSSQLPTFLLSSLARTNVSVSLSGDGGDELFGGYNRYYWATETWRRIRCLPRGLRSALAAGMRAVSPRSWDSIFSRLSPLLPSQLKQRTPGDKLHKLANVLDVTGAEEMYLRLISLWDEPSKLVVGAKDPETLLSSSIAWSTIPDFASRMMYMDAMTYLPDDILVKVDRAAMGVSLETRIPMLDHHVVEFAWRLPLDMKIRNGEGKWILREVLYRHVPKELVNRPKMGFGIPIDSWLRGELRDWAESLLAEDRLTREGFFHPGLVRQKWREHLSGKRNWQHHLWVILMFQAWLEAVQ